MAFCKSCGKGVCQDCLVVCGGNSYCKTCIESGRVITAPPSVAEAVPVPKIASSKAFFIVGGVGCGINTIVGVLFFLSALPGYCYGVSYWTVSIVLLAVGIILASVGYLGVHRNYGSGVGVASFAMAIVVGAFFVSWVTLDTIFDYVYIAWQLRVCIWASMYELFFVTMILWGVTHVTTRRFTGKSGLSLAAGIMLIVTAVFLNVSTSLWVAYDVSWFYDSYYLDWVIPQSFSSCLVH